MTARRMLLDTAGVYFRAFYSVPDTVIAPDGMPVNVLRHIEPRSLKHPKRDILGATAGSAHGNGPTMQIGNA